MKADTRVQALDAVLVTNENYYSEEANRDYFSVSQIKHFMKCEACTMAELDGSWQREPTPAMLVGSYVDAHFSHELDKFRALHPEIFTRSGELRSEFRQAEDIITRIERDKLAMRMLSGVTQEIITGEIEGHLFKAKLDVWLEHEQTSAIAREYPDMYELILASGAIVDMKIMRDFAPKYIDGQGRLSFIEAWGYDLQMAIYQRLKLAKLARLGTSAANVPCYIFGATKEKTPDIALYQIPQSVMDAAYVVTMEQIDHIVAVKRGQIEPERCEACDYCKATKTLNGATWFEEWL